MDELMSLMDKAFDVPLSGARQDALIALLNAFLSQRNVVAVAIRVGLRPDEVSLNDVYRVGAGVPVESTAITYVAEALCSAGFFDWLGREGES
jgi:hypothetical protein